MITDLSYLKTLASDDESFIRDMINIFREQFEEYAQGMPELLEKTDFINLSKLAHKAKSSVAVMGMSTVADTLQKLEVLAKTGDQSELYGEIVQNFLDQTRLAIDELEQAYP
jgi:HPt (histidine-containing phosphotransfer) domain-containing protein